MNIEKFEEYKNIPSILSDEYAIKSVSSASAMTIRCDSDLLGAQLIHYFNAVYKNFKFTGFNDKKFIDCLKFLIKDKAEFLNFLNMINIESKEFFKIIVFVSPISFTSNVIKFIHKNYLNIK